MLPAGLQNAQSFTLLLYLKFDVENEKQKNRFGYCVDLFDFRFSLKGNHLTFLVFYLISKMNSYL